MQSEYIRLTSSEAPLGVASDPEAIGIILLGLVHKDSNLKITQE